MGSLKKKVSSDKRLQTFLLNFGPQHPAAHGILKISLAMSGEFIIRSDLQFGLLHRGSEKLCESRSYTQCIPYLDRMDYAANLFQEHALVQAVESASICAIPRYPTNIVQYIRIIFDEFSRVLNHLLTLSAVCLDLGAMGPIFWAFEEREIIMELFERYSGARMHTALYRPFTLSTDCLILQHCEDMINVLQRGFRAIAGSFLGLISNRAMRSRCVGVGHFSPLKIKQYAIQGVIARASGVSCDSRLGLGYSSYSCYPLIPIRTFLGKQGDCYDRLMLRIRESLECYNLILFLLTKLRSFKSNFFPTCKVGSKFYSMEGVISHFKLINSVDIKEHVGFGYVEGPKGLVGVFLVNSGTRNPYRLHVRSPVAHNLHLLNTVTSGYTFADYVATFCSLDVVLGEIDR